MELPIIDEKGQSKATLAAPDELFGREFNEAVVHQVVTAYMANARLGTRAQKARGQPAGQHQPRHSPRQGSGLWHGFAPNFTSFCGQSRADCPSGSATREGRATDRTRRRGAAAPGREQAAR